VHGRRGSRLLAARHRDVVGHKEPKAALDVFSVYFNYLHSIASLRRMQLSCRHIRISFSFSQPSATASTNPIAILPVARTSLYKSGCPLASLSGTPEAAMMQASQSVLHTPLSERVMGGLYVQFLDSGALDPVSCTRRKPFPRE
jgi:hypothetical protein